MTRLLIAASAVATVAFSAVDGDMLLVRAGAPGRAVRHPSDELVAYSIG